MSSRIAIVSDTHLGRSRWSVSEVEALRPLWQGMTHLVINGDCAELHHPQYRTRAGEQVLRLHGLCAEDGVALLLLSGNHDPYLSDLRHLRLADDRVFVTHGDVLHRAVAPWSPASGAMRAAREAALAEYPPATRHQLESILSASRRAALTEWASLEKEAAHSSLRAMLLRPWTIVQVAWYWHRFPRLAARFAEDHAPGASVFLFGHTHRRGIWRFGRRTVINTGAFGFPGRPYLVVVEDETVAVHDAQWRRSRYEPGPIVHTVCLADTPPMAAHAGSR